MPLSVVVLLSFLTDRLLSLEITEGLSKVINCTGVTVVDCGQTNRFYTMASIRNRNEIPVTEICKPCQAGLPAYMLGWSYL